jgi:hypothetical protein
MYENPDASGRAPVDVQFSGAQQGNVAETDGPGRRGGKHGVQIVGGREDDRDQVGFVHVVFRQHGFDERLDPGTDLVDGVLVDGGRSSQGSNGSGSLIGVIGLSGVGRVGRLGGLPGSPGLPFGPFGRSG